MSKPVIEPDSTRDVLESDIPRDVLEILLADRTTGRNILWMTDGDGHLESIFNDPTSTSQRNTRCVACVRRGFPVDGAHSSTSGYALPDQNPASAGAFGSRNCKARSRGQAKPSPKGCRAAARLSPVRAGGHVAV